MERSPADLAGQIIASTSLADVDQMIARHPEGRRNAVVFELHQARSDALDGGDSDLMMAITMRAMIVLGTDDPNDVLWVALLEGLAEAVTQRFPHDEILPSAEGLLDQADLDPMIERLHPDIVAETASSMSVVEGFVYDLKGRDAVLDDALRHATTALDRLPLALRDLRWKLLVNRSNLRADRHKVSPSDDVLNDALDDAREALGLCPEGSQSWATSAAVMSRRLLDLYQTNGDRSVLESGRQLAEDAVHAAGENHPSLDIYLTTLSILTSELGRLQGDVIVLGEALSAATQAVSRTPPRDAQRPRHVNNLANRYADIYERTSDPQALHNALASATNAVESANPSLRSWAQLHSNLGNRFGDLYEREGEPAWLDLAIEHAEEAVRATQQGDRNEIAHRSSLVVWYGDKYLETQDQVWLDRARDEAPEQPIGSPPGDATRVFRSLARLHLLQGEHRRAASVLGDAFAALQAAVVAQDLGPTAIRDLAGAAEGMLGDHAAALIGAERVDEAVALLESDRIWFTQPGPRASTPMHPRPTPVRIIASEFEVIVVTGSDATVIPDLNRRTLNQTVEATLNETRGPDPDAAVDALDRMCDVASQIARHFPDDDELLLAPVGICAMLPYGAATLDDERYLIQRAALTLSPTLAWAVSAIGAPERRGAPVGVFDPTDLKLDEEIAQFRRQFPEASTLMAPPSQRVLDEAVDASVLHFSCHGFYNHIRPFDSALQLADPLSLSDILEAGIAPWLVNLSACETAIPDLSRIEQNISFPYGFLRGGSSHVVATLWPVDDRAAVGYNLAFYRHLVNGDPPHHAHRAAVEGLIAAGPSGDRSRAVSADDQPGVPTVPVDHPFWWAGFAYYSTAYSAEGPTAPEPTA